MNWFRNMNATPRLMGSFGVMIALTLGLGYLGINNLGKANERVSGLYQQDMKGSTIANDITISRMSLGRQGRDAILKFKDAAAVAADEKTMLSDFVKIHAALEGADQSFYLPEGVAAIKAIRQALPAYEKSYHELYQRIDAKDQRGAMSALTAITAVGQPIYDAADRARALKETLAEAKFQANNQAYQTARTWMIAVSGLSLLLGLILSFVIARGFAAPLGQAVQALERVAGGDLTVSLNLDTQDEVGRMALALNNAVERLNDTMQQVADSAASASSSSQQLAAAAEAIASGAQEQAASLEETSASMEEITAAVRQSADNAQQASQLAAGSKDSALQGQEVVSKAITAMSEINASSAKISDIISTIDEIAFQTNLLAVNAAVEAARAGDEGRGFAVVASEVRSLAQRSAVAAKEIKVLIQDSLHKVDVGSGLVNRSGETLMGIVVSVKRVTDIVGEMAASAGEQSTGIEQVNTAMTLMDQVTQSNSAQTEELSATAESLSEQAAHLMQLVSTFTLSQVGNRRQERQAFQPHLANQLKPVQQQNPMLQSKSAGRPLAKAVRSNLPAKSNPNPRGSKRIKSLEPALPVAIASEATVNEASFQEF